MMFDDGRTQRISISMGFLFAIPSTPYTAQLSIELTVMYNISFLFSDALCARDKRVASMSFVVGMVLYTIRYWQKVAASAPQHITADSSITMGRLRVIPRTNWKFHRLFDVPTLCRTGS